MMKNWNIGIILVLLMSLSLPVWAGNGGGSGSGSSTTVTTSSAGGGGNSNAEPGVDKGDLYGDLYIIVRDDNGEPILYEWTYDADGELEYDENTGKPYIEDSLNGFVQPIAADTCVLPDVFDGLVPLDAEGEIDEDYADCAQEVEFGRLNVARAPQDFLDRAYDEAIININAAEHVSVDAAGRLLLINGDEEKAIDAPRENLALYQQLMLHGYLRDLDRNDLEDDHPLNHLTVGDSPDMADMHQAAAFLAAAADKTGEINIDLVVYLNSILGINGDTGENYFNFNGYSYQRKNRLGQATADVLIGPFPGSENGYGGQNTGEEEVDWFRVGNVNILNKVFGGDDQSFNQSDSNENVSAEKARGFAKAGDDALKVISYIHNWAVPEYDEE